MFIKLRFGLRSKKFKNHCSTLYKNKFQIFIFHIFYSEFHSNLWHYLLPDMLQLYSCMGLQIILRKHTKHCLASLIVCANCLQKSQILKRKSQKAKQVFLTPTASKKSQISQIWCQKSQSGNPAVERKAVSILGQP